MSTSDPPKLPLEAASKRLRKAPGRPRGVDRARLHDASAIAPVGHTAGIPAPATRETSGAEARAPAREADAHPDRVFAFAPRLLDVESCAFYLGVSSWVIRTWISVGVLRKVELPGVVGDPVAVLRRVLIDREDVDRLVTRWSTRANRAARSTKAGDRPSA
jgi:hypothetical protein